MRHTLLAVSLLLGGLVACRATTGPVPPSTPSPEDTAPRPGAALETVHTFHGPVPTGVTVSQDGRIFVNFPRWGDPVTASVVELRDGKEVPYPSEELNTPNHPNHFLSVQSVVVDPRNRLWVLDTGSIDMGPIKGPEWPKLVGIDLATDKVFRVIRFTPEVLPPDTYLNDVRFDLRRGEDGMAFITDSSASGPSGIIVVDLASGRSWRKLAHHPSTRPDPGFSPVLEGEPFMVRPPNQPPMPLRIAADGIAISADGSRLFFCPLSSRDLYSVSVDALADEALPDTEVALTLRKEQRDFASDGLESDAQGRVYLTDWEHNAIVIRTPEGRFETLISDPRLQWPDTLSLATDGYLYVTANQLHRLPRFHDGQDLRQKPYHLYRIKVEGTPVLLTRTSPAAPPVLDSPAGMVIP